MARYIDADEFKKQIVGMAITNNYPVEKVNAMCELIDNQPTAYDVEAKVAELENAKHTICISDDDLLWYREGIDDAISIVREKE